MKKSLLLGLAGLIFSTGAPAYANEPYCREFTKTVYVGGRAQGGYGTACMQPDGSWQILADGTEDQPYGTTQYIAFNDIEPVHYVVRDHRQVYVSPYSFSLSFGNGWDHHHRAYKWKKWHKKHHYSNNHHDHHGRSW